jgi:hypothetical protein
MALGAAQRRLPPKALGSSLERCVSCNSAQPAGSSDYQHWPGHLLTLDGHRTPSAAIASVLLHHSSCTRCCVLLSPSFCCLVWSRFTLPNPRSASLHCIAFDSRPIAAQPLRACSLLSPTLCLLHILAFQTCANSPASAGADEQTRQAGLALPKRPAGAACVCLEDRSWSY